ncbi:Gamma-glutamylputrescine oxidoreductase [Carnimonas sp. R-84981]|uniref:NAD(P)/FAD-dependent oxidoreductase n=1 Tax=Carnimonas bestiolae TaxID=3402172 RepID=UPI003EDB9D39
MASLSHSSKASFDSAQGYYDATRRVALGPAPSLEGQRRADVCVIGGGITGCSTALHLAERGYSVVLLEAADIGHGASGRSGGQILPGLGTSMATFEQALGKQAARDVWEMSREAVALTERLIERYKIPCDYRKGYVHAANKRRHVNESKAWIADMAAGYDYHQLEWLDRQALQQHVVTDAYAGGVLDHDAGALHPLNYTLGLAAAAQRAGTAIHCGNRVTAIEHQSDGRMRVIANRGMVDADYVVQATNAYGEGLVSSADAHIMPVDNYIVATAPLTPEQVASVLPTQVAVSDARFVLDYYRLSADHRLLFGGQVSYSGHQPMLLDWRIRQRIRYLFPQLRSPAIDYRWGGRLAITMNRAPDFGRKGNGLYWAQGYSGHGMAFAGLAGKLVAESIAGQAERFDLFGSVKHRAFPGGKHMRTPLLVLATSFYKLRDLL